MINPEDFEKYKKAAKDELFRIIDRVQKRNTGLNPDKVLKDVTEVVEEVRQ